MEFKKEELVKSPLNYTGGKYKLLPQILPLFPEDIDTFVDLFAGGLDISLNVKSKSIISNDVIEPIIFMYNTFKHIDKEYILKRIQRNINMYNLSKTNKEGYVELRAYYNEYKHPIDLMTLIAYCYNNQIRFNSKWGFNRAFGENRSDFNPTLKNNLINTINTIQSKNIKFKNCDFRDLDLSGLSEKDLVYCDPPYLITNADYSIQASWDKKKEIELLKMLDELNSKGIKFALSNVIEHDGKINCILKEWSKKYNVHNLNHTYGNANADKRIKNGKSNEVLITNY